MIIGKDYSALQQFTKQANVDGASLRQPDKLTSGTGIGKVHDNAAGILSSEMFRSGLDASLVKGLSMESSVVAQDGITKLQAADAGLKSIRNILLEMKDSADIQADDQKLSLHNEEIHEIIKNTTFGSNSLLDGSFEETISVKTGADSGVIMRFSIKDMSFHPQKSIDESIEAVSDAMADIGKWMKQLEDSINSITGSETGLNEAESRISSIDVAKEVLAIIKANILNSPATAMLAQANQQPQGVLQLLR